MTFDDGDESFDRVEIVGGDSYDVESDAYQVTTSEDGVHVVTRKDYLVFIPKHAVKELRRRPDKL
jgi:predicted RNA-binding protein with PUA domain